MKLSTLILSLFFMSSLQAKDTIRVAFASSDFGNWHFCGTETQHKPQCEKGDELFGFNPDIAKEIFNRLNLNYEIVFNKWENDNFLKGLNQNKYDVIISNVAKKDSRKKYGIYSELPYEPKEAIGDYFFFALNQKELNLKSIGAHDSSITLYYLETLFKKEIIKKYSSTEELVKSLLANETSAIFGSFSIMKSFICNEPAIKRLTDIPMKIETKNENDLTYILSSKQKPKLANKIDSTLKDMHQDGTILRIYNRWLKKTNTCD